MKPAIVCISLLFASGILVSIYLLNKESDEKRSSRVDWQKVFDFLPSYNISCSRLFNGDASMPENLKHNLTTLTKMSRNIPSKTREGFTAENSLPYKAYNRLASEPFIKVICETGFNAGHSTYGWLTSNPKTHVYSFDIGKHNYSKPIADYIASLFPGRFHITWGDSSETLPEFHRLHPDIKCDLIIIDGLHTYSASRDDFYNFMKMASSNNILIMDNYPQGCCLHTLGAVWESAKRKGELFEIYRCDHRHDVNPKQFGFSVGRYVIREADVWCKQPRL